MIKLLLKERAYIRIPNNNGWTLFNVTSISVADNDRADANLPGITHRTYRGDQVTSLDAADDTVANNDGWTRLDQRHSIDGQVGMEFASLWQCSPGLAF